MKIKLCCIMLLTLTLLSSCGQTNTQNKCDIKDLLFNRTDFPEGTIINNPSSPVDGYPSVSANITASFLYDGLYQVVGRYSSIQRAERKFTERLGLYFKGDNFEGPWQTPVEISFRSPLAQQYHVACGKIGEKYQCRMIGQYDEHYVFFFAYISDNGINLATFQDLLMKIDVHMAQCVSE